MSSYRNSLRIPRATAPTWWIVALWLIAAVLAQTTILHGFSFRNIEPSLVLVLVLWYAIRADTLRAAAFGLAAGLLEDIVATQTGGAWTISTTIVAILASTISRGFFADSIPIVATITIVASLARRLIFWVVMGFEGYPPGLGTMHFHEAILQSAVNAVAMIVVMLIARRFDTRFA